MITASAPARQGPVWQRVMARAITDPAELLGLLRLDPALLPAARAAAAIFPLRVPRGYVERMRPGDPRDPLLLQVLPLGAETLDAPGFGPDPVGDLAAMARPGVLHKYRGRVLLVTTGACAVHCRYCFRRAFPYTEANPATEGWRQALDYIAADPSVEEVILSGGDPLSLSDARLGRLVTALEAVPHLRRLRLHTRQPVVLPERVDDGLLDVLGGSRLRTVVVIHANHPREIDMTVREALARLAAVGASLLNQSVLLRGVNDRPDVLAALSETLFAAGVLPYYLHLLDRVRGAGHFEVDETRAAPIMAALRERLPGYLVPRLVREEAGAPAKRPVPDGRQR